MLRALCLILTLVSVPAIAETVEIETYSGPVTVEKDPQTLVVLDIAALDTLDALGVSADGVVDRLYVPYLDAGDAQIAGTLFEPDYEALAAMAPDLIIAGGRSQGVIADLTRLAPTIDMTIWEDTVATGLARLDAYGKIFGRQDRAAELAAAFDAKLVQARQQVAGRGGALIVMTNGPKISVYGSGGRFGWMHDALDLTEAVPEVEQASHGEAVSFEFIRDADPDIVIVIDRLAAIGQDSIGAQATLDNPLVHQTAAWQQGRVIYLDSAATYIAAGGIQSLNLFLDQIIAAFPES
jgi:iron complex transport system substrate-binding protein